MSDISLDIKDEIKLLNEALQDNENLFTEIKGHYDKVKQGGPGTLQFVEKQTSNLISLKANRVSIIQQMITAKKTEAEMKLKIANAGKDDSGNSALIGEISASMYDLILKGKGDKSFDELVGTQKNDENAMSEEDVDAILEARMAEEESKTKIEVQEEVIEETKNEYQYVVDIHGNVYCLDDEYNIIEDAPELDATITINVVDNEYVATDENGVKYEVVEFEEEE